MKPIEALPETHPWPDTTPRPGIWRYSAVELLVALLLLCVSVSFVEHRPHGDLIEAALLTLVMLSAVLAVGGRGRNLLVALLVVGSALVGKWMNHVRPDMPPLGRTRETTPDSTASVQSTDGITDLPCHPLLAHDKQARRATFTSGQLTIRRNISPRSNIRAVTRRASLGPCISQPKFCPHERLREQIPDTTGIDVRCAIKHLDLWRMKPGCGAGMFSTCTRNSKAVRRCSSVRLTEVRRILQKHLKESPAGIRQEFASGPPIKH